MTIDLVKRLRERGTEDLLDGYEDKPERGMLDLEAATELVRLHGALVRVCNVVRAEAAAALRGSDDTIADPSTCAHEWTDVARCLRCELTYDMYEGE